MASDLPIVRQISILSLIVTIIIIVGLLFLFYQLDRTYFYLEAPAMYIFILFALHYFIPVYHRKGVAFYKRGDFQNAIQLFEKSYHFFTKHRIIDKYRFIFILSSSKISYREMALVNWAFCLSQINEKTKAIEKYQECLSSYPASQIAISALKMLNG